MQELDRLVHNLQTGDETVRRYAAEDLGSLGLEGAVPALVTALEDPVVAVREAAAEALGVIGGRETARRVVPLMASEEVPLRNISFEILEALSLDALEELTACCTSPVSDIRKFAVDILGKIGEVSEIDAEALFVRMLDDPNPNVAGAAAEAIGRVGYKGAVPALLQHLDSHAWLQCNILHAIARIGGEAAQKAFATINTARLSPEAQYYHRTALMHCGLA
ncbi:HEAT repeat domain-containing protein [Megalodesulfovibrio gigas]|uniref:HEAT repeat domain-containing protein n=1 Tax=Megalodesulfovibrio gigas (strain ATCC 19364 / DSM 1382 / NCIMB 9332 / VKM B-1759) TaxID=1121448 RepID=T2GEC4_MEGG1|nr:HEAT repeat domain-containing protein [Megalodesulfovibrio gigas]AGW14950.1 hypothetical protein DGI_3248 [Megalodesulfovibrio gigas DSM 1382 = ATCC 19364]